MSTLRLGAYQLPAAEVVLVQTLFRLYAHNGGFHWTFVSEPPYDALLVDSATAQDMGPAIDRMAKAVLRLTRLNAGNAANTMERPIRADRLQDWLKATEHALAQTRPMGEEDEPLHSALASTQLTSAVAASAEVVTQPVRFRLRRWPPAALLRGDPKRIRMATLLSRRALSAAELARISQLPLPDCQAFLNTLQTTGLVDAQQPPPAATVSASSRSAATATAAAAASSASSSAPSFARGLIAGIRRRLGL